MLNVRDFGAKGDGIVDDTAAIQTAINSGNEIYIPYGTYLITSNLQLKSNIIISGDGILKANADGLYVFTSGTVGIQNVQIVGITIDGGGQVGGVVTTGKKAATGIYLTNASSIIIDKVNIKNCGIINSADPQIDSGFGGFGIYAWCYSGKIENIKITNCTFEKMAGGGINSGDGIVIGGYNSDLDIIPEDILISNCTINTVGRNGISLAGDSGTSLSRNIRVVNTYVSYTQLAGIDVEDGSDIIISDCQFYYCGKGDFTYYYNYPSSMPVTYALRSAIATFSLSNNISVADTIITYCNMGINYGAMLNKIMNVFISDSDTTDITQGLANAGDLLISDCQFLSNIDMLNYYSPLVNNVKISNSIFVGSVVLNQISSGVFLNCTFKNGIIFGPSVSSNITWDDCDFVGTGTGIGIKISTTSDNLAIKNGIVSHCRFTNLDTGILVNYNDIVGWIIEGNIFANMVSYGIKLNNAGALFPVKSISDNKFINESLSSGTAISIAESPERLNVSANYFEYITNCISIIGIVSGRDLLDTTINNNVAFNCTNGLSITQDSGSPGSWDRCIVTLNNFHGCSGNKMVLLSGNTNGFVSDNIL